MQCSKGRYFSSVIVCYFKGYFDLTHLTFPLDYITLIINSIQSPSPFDAHAVSRPCIGISLQFPSHSERRPREAIPLPPHQFIFRVTTHNHHHIEVIAITQVIPYQQQDHHSFLISTYTAVFRRNWIHQCRVLKRKR